MSRVVISGASGFIGQRLALRIAANGFDGSCAEIVAIVRDPARLPDDLRERCDVHALDLATAPESAIGAACGNDAVVFHLAADASVTGGDAAARANTLATDRLLSALSTRSPRRVVYVSSIGAVDRQPGDSCALPLDENSPPYPLTRYGASKLHGERQTAASGVAFSIVRPTWVYGPGMREGSHLRSLLAMVRRGSLVTRFRFPGRVSVIHVDDLCEALLLAATHRDAAGQTFFASDGVPVSLGELFGEFGRITGRASAGTVGVPGPVAGIARAVRRVLPLAAQNLHSDVLCASNEKIAALGFVPRVSRHRGFLELARATAGPAAPARAIVTGAANGIGRALAEQLYARGTAVIAVDLDAVGLAALAADCPGTEPVVADLSLATDRARLADRIAGSDADVVVNCAGIGVRGRVGALTAAAEARVIEVNATALATLSSAALQAFRARGTGSLVNVASSAALQPLPLMATYAASKAFVLSYSEALAEECAGEPGVRVITILPGGTDTGFQAAAGVRRVDGERLLGPHDVGARILEAIDAGRSATIYVGFRTFAMSLLARLIPRRWLVALWGRLMGSLR